MYLQNSFWSLANTKTRDFKYVFKLKFKKR